MPRFLKPETCNSGAALGAPADLAALQKTLDSTARRSAATLNTLALPGPTGESNQLTRFGRGTVLCLGPSAGDLDTQAAAARAAGCWPVTVGIEGADITGILDPEALTGLHNIDAVVCWADETTQRKARQALARRSGAIIPLISDRDLEPRLQIERHVCIDTTAAGGNAALLAEVA